MKCQLLWNGVWCSSFWAPLFQSLFVMYTFNSFLVFAISFCIFCWILWFSEFLALTLYPLCSPYFFWILDSRSIHVCPVFLTFLFLWLFPLILHFLFLSVFAFIHLPSIWICTLLCEIKLTPHLHSTSLTLIRDSFANQTGFLLFYFLLLLDFYFCNQEETHLLCELL